MEPLVAVDIARSSVGSFLVLSDVSFAWKHGDDPVLDGLNLNVALRERLFVQGPSGSGKSTLLNLLAGQKSPVPTASSLRLSSPLLKTGIVLRLSLPSASLLAISSSFTEEKTLL